MHTGTQTFVWEAINFTTKTRGGSIFQKWSLLVDWWLIEKLSGQLSFYWSFEHVDVFLVFTLVEFIKM